LPIAVVVAAAIAGTVAVVWPTGAESDTLRPVVREDARDSTPAGAVDDSLSVTTGSRVSNSIEHHRPERPDGPSPLDVIRSRQDAIFKELNAVNDADRNKLARRFLDWRVGRIVSEEIPVDALASGRVLTEYDRDYIRSIAAEFDKQMNDEIKRAVPLFEYALDRYIDGGAFRSYPAGEDPPSPRPTEGSVFWRDASFDRDGLRYLIEFRSVDYPEFNEVLLELSRLRSARESAVSGHIGSLPLRD
jgi:hypothetical protein